MKHLNGSNRMANLIPWVLVGVRLVLGPVLLVDSLDGETDIWFVIGLLAAFGSDYFDGVIARWLGSVDRRLRIADSRVDAFFMLCVAGSAWFGHRETVMRLAPLIGLKFGIYFISLLLPWLKFRELPAYHAYSAKAAGLLLFIAVITLFWTGAADMLLKIALWTAVLSHLDRIAISMLLSESATDIPGFWAVL
ncbi:MAG: CDP-diacylglycerol--glycerol-3-phosphate 3-phosphatidyltransferase [Anaerolineae bacterium]|nr:CDP-diacylglycerol--glycerol-3-phosphate 3-phosphatidyltransferase [Anaerolineae bacterium]